jgi:hypothetical protein
MTSPNLSTQPVAAAAPSSFPAPPASATQTPPGVTLSAVDVSEETRVDILPQQGESLSEITRSLAFCIRENKGASLLCHRSWLLDRKIKNNF